MGTRIFKCQKCGSTVLENWDDNFNHPNECPYCGHTQFSYEGTKYDSTHEKETDEYNAKENAKQLKVFGVAFLVFVALIYPGILLLMLLHTFVNIESDFLNWILTLAFSGAILFVCKGNIKTYLKVDLTIFIP